jgi:hypothetical protein
MEMGMKSMGKTVRVVAVMTMLGVGWLARAEASPIITIAPVTQTKVLGNTFTVNIDVTNLNQPTEAVGAWGPLDLSYNPAILSGVSFVNDPALDLGIKANTIDFSGGFGPPGTLDLNFSGDPALSQATLAANEGASFVLATVTFNAIGVGLSPLTLSSPGQPGLILSDYTGQASLTGVTSVPGSVCVVAAPAIEAVSCAPNTAVPEPTTMMLLGTGLTTLIARRRRSHKRSE